MRAVTWQGHRSVAVEDVEDPTLVDDDDAIISVSSTAICGSDLHLYEVLGPFMQRGDILGHEAIGTVVEVGPEVHDLQPGDRVVVPFNIACGNCFMCSRGLQSQCEITQVREQGSGAALYGYSRLYGSIPGSQAEFVRVPFANYGPIKITDEGPDERYLYLSDILPTAWQAVTYADAEPDSTVVVIGLGPVGQLAARIAAHRGHDVIGVDPLTYRRDIASRHGIHAIELDDDTVETIMDRTQGRGAAASIDAVGMESHGSPAKLLQRAAGLLPDALARKAMSTAGVDALGALSLALRSVRRGGTVSLAGVYGGMADPMPLMQMFDRQLQLRMGQCNVRHWIDNLMPLVQDADDPLGLESLASHTLPLQEAPVAYQMFQQKDDDCMKVVLKPGPH